MDRLQHFKILLGHNIDNERIQEAIPVQQQQTLHPAKPILASPVIA